jgi:hypothetical protein
MPKQTTGGFPLARKSKNMPDIGCRAPALVAFTKGFLRDLGPVEDRAEAVDILGSLARRSRDAALRRRINATRIALLSQNGSSAQDVTPKEAAAEEPKVLVVEEWPSAITPAQEIPAPTRPKAPPKLQMTSLEDAAKTLLRFDEDAPAVTPRATLTIPAKPEPVVARPTTEEPEPIDAVEQPADSSGPTFEPEPTVRYAQETSKVMNAARPVDSNPMAAAPKKKKKRSSAPGPIDFSALADFGDPVSDQTETVDAEPLAAQNPSSEDTPPEEASPEKPARKD